MSTLKVDTIQDTSGTVRRGLMTYAIIGDQKASNADGGSFTSGAHRTRDLNTVFADPDSIVSVSSNQFTLGAGSYLIRATVPGFRCDRHAARLKNVTDDTDVAESSTNFVSSGASNGSNAIVVTRVTITESKTFEIRHKCQTTKSTNGFGVSADATANNSIFTVVEIYKEA